MVAMKQVGQSIGIGAVFSAGTFLGAGLCSLANKVHVFSLLKRSLPVGIVGGVATAISTGIILGSDCEEDMALSLMVTTLALTVLASPTLSKYISSDRTSYIQAAALSGVGLGAGLTLLGGGLFSIEAAGKLRERLDRRQEQPLRRDVYYEPHPVPGKDDY